MGVYLIEMKNKNVTGVLPKVIFHGLLAFKMYFLAT